MRIIYADSMFLLNFTVDYLLLLATGKICALPLVRRRMALAAAWGGLYAVLSVVWPSLFALATVKIIAGAVTAAIAFGLKDRFPRILVVFFAVSAAFGGAVYAALCLGGTAPHRGPVLGVSTRTLVLSFALCYAALSLVFRGLGRRAQREVHSVELRLRSRSVNFRALRDTGNELADSAGRPVMAAQWSAVAELFPELNPAACTDPAELCLALSALDGMDGRCRLLSCLTATDSCGLVAAFRPDTLLIEGAAAPHRLVALIPHPVSPDGDYQALI